MTSLALLALTLAAPSDTVELTVKPREGLALRRSIEQVVTHDIAHVSDGEELFVEGENVMELVLLDRQTKVEDGALLRFEREYEELAVATEDESDYGEGPVVHVVERESELEGEVVEFTREEADGAFTASCEELDDELLEGLRWSLDFDLLLPAEPVEVGDEWELDLTRLPELNEPGRGIPWSMVVDGEEIEVDEAEEPERTETFEGEVTLTLREVRDVEGVVLATLTLEGECEAKLEIDGAHEDEDVSSEFHQEMDSEIALEGEAVWNVTAGRLQRLVVEAEYVSVGVSESTTRFGDEVFEDAGEFEVEGTHHLEVTVEEVRED